MNLPSTVNIPESVKFWLSAKQGANVNSLSFPDLKRELMPVVATATGAITNGQFADQSAIEFVAMGLADFLKNNKKCSALTVSEIAVFLKKGVINEYPTFRGQMNAVNVQNVSHWVKCGLEDEERLEALKMQNKIIEQEQVKREPTPEDIERINIMGLKTCIEYVKTGKTSAFSAPFKHIYDYLNDKYGVEVERKGEKKKTLIPDNDEAIELTNIAKKKFEADKYKVRGDSLESLFNWKHSYEMYCKDEYCKRFIEKSLAQGIDLLG